jgi:hypothetical protein
MNSKQPSQLTDTELVAEVGNLALSERRATADLVAHLAELEARRLHLRAGFRSLFAYCTEVLRLSEGGAYNRIEAAHLARRYPAVLDLLAQGRLNLGTLRLLGPHLTPENQDELFSAASGKSKREVQQMLAAMFPRPDVVASIRKLPTPSTGVFAAAPASVATGELESGGPECSSATERASGAADHGGCASPSSDGSDRPSSVVRPNPDGESMPWVGRHLVPTCGQRAAGGVLERPASRRHPAVTPLSADRYQFRFAASEAAREKFRRAQDLLRHAIPSGDPGEIFDRALTALLKELERKRFAATERPRAGRSAERGSPPASRHIPAAVKRAVMARDGGRCAFVADAGRRCGTTAFLEFHHVVPFARGGPPTEDNIQLRCRAHNGLEADLDFGRGGWGSGNSSRDESSGERLRANSSRGGFRPTGQTTESRRTGGARRTG